MARPARYGGVQLSLPEVYSGLRNAGLPHNQAANLAGVLHAESGGYTGSFINSSTERPGALNTQGAYGLAQLNGPRQQQLLDFAGSSQAAADPQTQLNFIAQDAQSGRYGNLDLNNVRSIVDRYETPRVDLRAGEAAVGLRNANSLSDGSYDPTLGGRYPGGINSSPVNSNSPVDNPSSTGLQAPGNAYGLSSGSAGYASSNGSGNYYYNPDTGAVTPTTDTNPPGTTEGFGIIDKDKGILYGGGTGPYSSGLPGGSGVPTTGFDSTGGFTSANAGVFGNTATPNGVTGLGAPNTNPNGYSLDGATLDKNVSAQSVAGGAGSADNIAGWNSAGPVMTNPAVVGAINTSGQKVSTSVDKGAKQIGDDTKEAGKTIGQSVTGLSGQLKGISDSWQALGKDYFVRLAFIVVGLIALAAGLMLFKPVQNAAGAVAARVPKIPV